MLYEISLCVFHVTWCWHFWTINKYLYNCSRKTFGSRRDQIFCGKEWQRKQEWIRSIKCSFSRRSEITIARYWVECNDLKTDDTDPTEIYFEFIVSHHFSRSTLNNHARTGILQIKLSILKDWILKKWRKKRIQKR